MQQLAASFHVSVQLGHSLVREQESQGQFQEWMEKQIAFPVKFFTDVRNRHKHPQCWHPTKNSGCFLLLSCLPPHTPLARDQCPSSWDWLGGKGANWSCQWLAEHWASPHISTPFIHVIQDTHAIGAEFCWYRPPPLLLFSACGYFSFTTCPVLIPCIFQHMHAAFSVPAASQNTLNRLNKNTFMPMLASFVRAETVHLTDLLLLCVC